MVKGRRWRAAGALSFGVGVAALAAAGPALAASTKLTVTSVSSIPSGARSATLRGNVANADSRAGSAALTVRVIRHGGAPQIIGRTNVRVAGSSSASYRVAVHVPARLKKGSYFVAACTSHGGGTFGCATSEQQLKIDGGDPVVGVKARAAATAHAAADVCSSGAHTLSQAGDHVYPETGNGGYKSVHTDMHMIYLPDRPDPSNPMATLPATFLPGNHVDLTDQATQCLTDFSLDFETHGPGTDSPNLAVNSVTVNGQPATWQFVQPTYPGDPNGQNDPDPNAHMAGQVAPVGPIQGSNPPATNPDPPACAPQSNTAASSGVPCPANKLVITPSAPIPNGTTFVVEVGYTGTPGVHHDGDGTTEGWFDDPTGGGGFVTTEPVGTEDWMPLNDHPSAKPTYDFYDQVPAGLTGIGNGVLVSQTSNAADANFPNGSTTWHWNMPSPIANYLVEDSVGNYNLSERMASDGLLFYEAQNNAISAAKQTSNKAIMDMQQDITDFQSQFNGPFPFSTDGVIVGIPSASFEEEMETKITFAGGSISLSTFNHENMHQWWGDNVTESNYNMTFYKEGMAQLAQYMLTARTAQTAAGGPGTPAGDAAFDNTLISQFNSTYNSTRTSWTGAPSNPTPNSLFTTASTYTRPATAYIALRQILGDAPWAAALQKIQKDYGGGFITEPELEAEYHQFMPNQSAACSAKLDQFFQQWFDTAYPTTGTVTKPTITGPGLAGQGFYDANGNCSNVGVTQVGGTVPAQLGLTLGTPATFGAFTPGVTQDYNASMTANVVSTAGDGMLSVSDPSSTATGHLVNGTFSLPQALQADATSAAGTGGAFAPVGGSANPTTLLTYSNPTSNDAVTVNFKQSIGANDALRTGSYSKTLTFTLSTDQP